MTPPMTRHKQHRGVKLPPGVKACGRPSRWGNPWRVVPDANHWRVELRGDSDMLLCALFDTREDAAEYAAARYREFARVMAKADPAWLDPLRAAAGLACPGCEPTDPHCHVAVLIDLIRETTPCK